MKPTIQYKQIEQIAEAYDVGFYRTKIAVDDGRRMVTVPAVRLSGFLSNIQAALTEIRALSGGDRYYSDQAADGVYLYV